MPHPRTVIGLCSLLLAIFAWGCSSSDASETNQPAAQPDAVSSLEVSSPVFTEIRPRKRIPQGKHLLWGKLVSSPGLERGAGRRQESRADSRRAGRAPLG